MKSIRILACLVLFMSGIVSLKAQSLVVAGDNKGIVCEGSVQLNAESIPDGIWERINLGSVNSIAMSFVNDHIGFITSPSGVIIKTVDAGKTWSTLNTGTTTTLSAIKFLNENIGFAAGNSGALLKTTNGGDTWIALNIKTTHLLKCIYILSPDKILVGSSAGEVFISNDGGLTWTLKNLNTSNSLNEISFTSPNVGYVCGVWGTILKTVDGGENWSKPLDFPTPNPLVSMSFITDSIGVVVTSSCSIYKTIDGGKDWLKVIGDSVYENYLTNNDSLTGVHGISLKSVTMRSIYMANKKLIFATGYNVKLGGFILKSVDGGRNWKIEANFPGDKVYAGSFLNAKSAFIGGPGGFFAKYTTPSSNAVFTWHPATGLSNPAIANPIASPAETTTYYVTSTDNGSTATDSLKVNVLPLRALPGTDKAIGCEGSVQLDSVKSNYSGRAGLKYRWTPSAGLNNDTIPNPIATVTSNTKYTFSISTPGGCSASDSLTVKINDLIVNPGKDKSIVCGGIVTMDSVKTNYSGSKVLRYKWTPSTGLTNDTIPNPTCKTLNSITYTVNVSSGLEHCSASGSVRVIVNPLTVNAGTSKSVACGPAILMDSVTTNYTGTGKLLYKWIPSTGLNNDTIARPLFTGSSYTNYRVTVTTPEGCTASDNVVVNVNPLTVNVGADRSGICGSSVQLGIASTNYTGIVLKYKWSPSTGLNNDTIMNPIATVSKMTYVLTVTTPSGCTANDNVAINVIPMSKPSLSYIGVNSNIHNQLYWTKPYNTGIEFFNIYKETNVSNVYSKIGSVPFSSEATFVDSISKPDVQSNKYKISLVEQCGGETALSDYHKTLHLSINKGMDMIWNLNWEPYEGFVVSTYNIYRGTTSSNMQIIGSMSGSNTQFSDYTASTGNVYYQIEAVGAGSNLIKNSLSQDMKAQSAITSKSNIASNIRSGTINLNDISNSFVIYPNPATSNIIYVKTEHHVGENIQLNIINGVGQLIKTVHLTEYQQQIDISTLSDGFYLMIFNTGNMIGKQKLFIQR